MKRDTVLRIAFTIAGVVVAIAYQFWPAMSKVNPYAVGILFLAFLPWLLPWLSLHITNIKVPGFEIGLRQLEKAAEKITGESGKSETVTGTLSGTTLPLLTAEISGTVHPPTVTQSPPPPSYVAIYETNPNLALVGLRIEIEKRLRRIADAVGLSESRLGSVSTIPADLVDSGLMSKQEISGISELMRAGNRAAHGAAVEPEVAEWAMKKGPAILAALESKLQEIKDADPPIKITKTSYLDTPLPGLGKIRNK